MLEPLDCWRDALPHALQAHDLFLAAGHTAGAASALNNVGWYHAQLGDFRQTLVFYRQALALFRDFGDRYYEADTLRHLGAAFRADGRLDEARAAWRDALTILDQLGHPDAELVGAELTRLDHDLDHDLGRDVDSAAARSSPGHDAADGCVVREAGSRRAPG